MRKQLLFSAVLAASLGVQAQVTAPTLPSAPPSTQLKLDGTDSVYIYNVKAQKFICDGGAWGTQTILKETGALIALVRNEDGSFQLRDQYTLRNVGNWGNIFVNSFSAEGGDSYADGNNKNDYQTHFIIYPATEGTSFEISVDTLTANVEAGEYGSLGQTRMGYKEGDALSGTSGGYDVARTQVRPTLPTTDADYANYGVEWQAISQADYATYAAAYDIYLYKLNTLMPAINEAIEVKADVDAQIAVYNNAESTLDQLKEAYTAVQEAIANAGINKCIAAMKQSAPGATLDISEYIANVSSIDGWTIEGDTWNKGNDNITLNEDGTYTKGGMLQRWRSKNDGAPLSPGKIYQTLKGLPNGTYIFSASVNASKGYGDQQPAGTFVFANNDSVESVSEANMPKVFSVKTDVTDGKISFGLNVSDINTANYIYFANVKLEYINTDSSYTSRIVNPSFDNGNTGWTGVPTVNGDYHNAEAYQTNFDANQTIEGLPNGVYELTVQGYQRMGPGWTQDAYNAHVAGTEGEIGLELYGNSSSQKMKCLYDEYMTEKADNDQELEGKFYANSLKAAKAAFDQGLYLNKLEVTISDGTLKIGVRGISNTAEGYWSCFDNFTLTYLRADVTGTLKKDLASIIEAAKAYSKEANANADLIEALNTAITSAESAAAKDDATVDELNAAIAAINTAQDAVKTNASAYDALKAIDAQSVAKNYNADYYADAADLNSYIKADGNGNSYEDITCQYLYGNEAINSYADSLKAKLLAAAKTFELPGVDLSSQVTAFGQLAEAYQSTFDKNETLTLPNGSYILAIEAFQRRGWNDVVYPMHQSGEEQITAYAYANGDSVKMHSVFDFPMFTAAVAGNDYNPATGIYFTNSMNGTTVAMDLGGYKNIVETNVTDGTLKYGVACADEEVKGNGCWAIWRGAQLHVTQVELDENKANPLLDIEGIGVNTKLAITENEWNTICLPFSLSKEQVVEQLKDADIREFTKAENGYVDFSTKAEAIEAGKAYLIKGGSSLQAIYAKVDLKNALDTVKAEYGLQGVYNPTDLPTDGTAYVITSAAGTPSLAAPTEQLKALHAYIVAPAEAKDLKITVDGIPTGLTAVKAQDIDNAPVYNLNGQLVGNGLKNMKKGVYIVNGKKTVKK